MDKTLVTAINTAATLRKRDESVSEETDLENMSLTELRVLVGHLRSAVASHEVVGQAIGVLLTVHQIPPDQAWHLLCRTSQNTNVKVIRLATSVVEAAAGLATTDPTSAAVIRAHLLPSLERRRRTPDDDGVTAAGSKHDAGSAPFIVSRTAPSMPRANV